MYTELLFLSVACFGQVLSPPASPSLYGPQPETSRDSIYGNQPPSAYENARPVQAGANVDEPAEELTLPDLPVTPALPTRSEASPSFYQATDDDTAQKVLPVRADAPLVAIDDEGLATASGLIREALTPREGSQIKGAALGLLAIVEKLPESGQRREAIARYWQLCHAVANYHFAIDETDLLLNLPLPQSADQKALLAAAQTAAKARQTQTRLAVLLQQQQLARIVSTDLRNAPPLPKETPLVRPYETHFSTLRSRGAAPAHLEDIDQLLPVLHLLINDQAEAVFAAQQALGGVQNNYAQGLGRIEVVLETFDNLTTQRRGFLDTVERYNQQIAQYALSVNLPSLTHHKLVGMLIEHSQGVGSVVAEGEGDASAIRRVSNEEPLETSSDGATSVIGPMSPVQPAP